MNRREFIYSLNPESAMWAEVHLAEAKRSLNEFAFKDWASQFPNIANSKLGLAMLREQWNVRHDLRSV